MVVVVVQGQGTLGTIKEASCIAKPSSDCVTALWLKRRHIFSTIVQFSTDTCVYTNTAVFSANHVS